MSLRFLASTALAALAAQRVAADCRSFGVDFQDGGSYFQNSLSTDQFTFVSQFEGCQNDTATNVLVDPNGDQYLCTDTNLQPDDVDQLSTCPEEKDQLFSGEWSVVILSNNGDAEPIAYQRDFYLTVGPQQTTTYTPTVIYSTTTTPFTSVTLTQTYTTTVVAPTPTVTVPSTTITRTYKVTPTRVTTTVTSTLATTTKVVATISVIKTTVTRTPICHLPTVNTTPDKTCSIKITATSVATPRAKLRFARDSLEKEAFLKERREFLSQRRALEKREPDPPTSTVTDTNTSDYPTSTLTVTIPTTVTYYATVTTTTTSTPATVTIQQGKTTAPAVTTTLPTPTRTIRQFTILTTTVSTTYYPTITITRKTTQSGARKACKSAGGVLY